MARWSDRLGPWDSLGDDDLMEAPSLAAGKRPRAQDGPGARTATPGKVTLTERLPTMVVARDATGPAPFCLPEAVRSALGSADGAPLPDAGTWSRRLGADVSSARVVTGARAEAAAESISARAFTVGDRIFFGAGQSPSSESLLRHELTHVVQQQGAAMPAHDDLRITSPDEAMEQEAHGGDAPGARTGTAVIARDEIYLPTSEYITRHAEAIKTGVSSRLDAAGEAVRGRLGNPAVTWAAGPGPIFTRMKTVIDAVGHHGMRQLVEPTSLENCVDRGRVITRTSGDGITTGNDQWKDAVAIAIVDAIVRGVGNGIDRVAQKYAFARSAAQQRAWKERGECDPAVAPEARAGEVIPAHPADRFIIASAIEDGIFQVDLGNWRTNNPGLADQEVVPGLRDDVTAAIVGNSTNRDFEDPGTFFVWLRATPADATVEEVAKAFFGGPEHAFRFTVKTPPLFAFNATMVWSLPQEEQDRVVGQSPALQEERERRKHLDTGEPHFIGFMVPKRFLEDPEGTAPRRDPTAGLPPALADEAAQASARASAPAGGTPRDRSAILSQMGQNRSLLHGVIGLGERFEMGEAWLAYGGHTPAAIETGVQRLDDRRQRLATAPDAEVQQWDGHAQGQARVLSGVTTALTELHRQVNEMTRATGPAPDQYSDAFNEAQRSNRLPLIRLASAYVGAAAASDLPETGMQQLAAANAQARQVPAEMMEIVIAGIQEGLSGIKRKARYDAYGLEVREDRLRTEISALRQALLSQSPDAAAIMQRIWAEIEDLQTETTMVAQMDALDDAGAAMEDLADSFGVWGDEDAALRTLKSEAAQWRGKWEKLRLDWQALQNSCPIDPEAAKADIKRRFDELRNDPGFADFLGRAQAAMKDAEQSALIARLVALLAITVVTMGVGAVVGGGAMGVMGVASMAEASAGATVVIVGSTLIAESLVGAALSQAFFGKGWDWSAFGQEFAFNMVLGGALQGVSRVLKVGRLGTFLEDTGQLHRVQTGVQGVVTVVGTRLHAEMTAGRQLSDEEKDRIVTESVVSFVVGAVLARVGQRLLGKLEGIGGRLGEKIAAANLARTAARDKALSTKTLDDVRELLAKDAESLKKDIEALEELQRAPNDPEARAGLKERGMTDAELDALSRDMPGAILRLKIAQAVQGVEQIGGDNFAAPQADLPGVLSRLQQAGARVKTAGQDTVTGDRVFEAEFADGTKVRIYERASEPRPGADGTQPTPEQAAAARASADAAAAVQRARDEQVTRLIQSAGDPIVVDEVIAGAGQAGTLAHAALARGGGKGAPPPGVDIVEIPNRLNIAPEGSMFSHHGDFAIGQKPGELASPSMTRQPGEFTSNHDAPTPAADYVRALNMTGYETGQVTYKASIEAVEVNPQDGSWPVDAPMRVKAGGRIIYVRKTLLSAMGMGPPRPTGLRGEAALLASRPPKLVFAQDSLTLPGGGKKVLIIGGGATGAWAVEKAISMGMEVVWSGRAKADAAVPEAVRTELARRGFTEDQITAFYAAYNARNTTGAAGSSAFDNVGTGAGKVELRTASLGEATVEANGKVKIGDLEVDGVIAATGQTANLPPGMEGMKFKPVVAFVDNHPKLVGLDPVDAAGNVIPGMRLVGAQAMNPAMADHVVPADVPRFRRLVEDGARRARPGDSRGVSGSIHQTNENVPLALNAPEAPMTPVPVHGEHDEDDGRF